MRKKLLHFTLLVMLMFLGYPVASKASDCTFDPSHFMDAKTGELSNLKMEADAAKIVSCSISTEIPPDHRYIAWIGAYHAYINRQQENRTRIFYLLGEAGAAVSQETQQGKLYKAYMLARINLIR